MAVNNTNLYFALGDTFTFSCLAQDYQQNVINLTGATITCTAKNEPNAITHFSGTTSVTSASAGTFTVTFASSATSALPNYPQSYNYDIIVTKTSQPTSVQSGTIYLTPYIS